MLAFAPHAGIAAGAPEAIQLARQAARRETEAMEARAHYTYRQAVRIQEFASKGGRPGEYREIREVIFSPSGERTERFVGKPMLNLSRLHLTEEDFQDVREVQPFLLTSDMLWLYQTKFRGEEQVNGVDCWLLEVKPRQTHQGMRLFDGVFWIAKSDSSVIRSEGVAVPQIISRKSENLFPRFVTERTRVDQYWFPTLTFADDTLPFSSGPIRVRMSIEYKDYRRFGASSTVTFDAPGAAPKLPVK